MLSWAYLSDYRHYCCFTGCWWRCERCNGIAKILFVVFLVMFIVSFVMGRCKG